MAGYSRPPARHAKVPKVAVDHLTRSNRRLPRRSTPEPTPSPLNSIVRTLGGGTEGSNPACSSAESLPIRFWNRRHSAFLTVRYETPSPSVSHRCRFRVALLYLRGHVFGCRKCCGLAYSIQSENPHFRAITKAQKLRIRLGGNVNLLEDFPAKPPRMHRRTYDRLLARLLTAQERWVGLSRDYLRRL